MTAAALPFVSVIIPTRNEEGYIAACLNSVLEGTYPHDRMEILIVDGKSDDRTREIVLDIAARHHLVRLLENPARAVPNAMNIGIRAARGDLIVRMDAHARYGATYVTELTTWMQRLEADNVGGICIAQPASDTPQARAVALILSHPFGVGDSKFRLEALDTPLETDTVPFGCYRREVFDRIGLYDELFIRNQDDELNARLKQAGGRIFLIPQIKIEYFTRPSLRKLALMLYQYGYFKPLAAIKLGRPATTRQLVPPAFTLALLGLPLLFRALPWTLPLWGVTAGAHCIVNLAVSARQAQANGWRLLPYLSCGFILAHLSYGWGYLRGLLEFGLLRRHLKKVRGGIPLSR